MMEESDSFSDDSWSVAQDFRKPLNSRKHPSITKVSTNDPDDALTNTNTGLELDDVALTTVEGVPVYRELDEDQDLPMRDRYLHRVVPQPIWNALKPPIKKKEWKKFLFVHLPIIQWVLHYTPKLLLGDFISGLTIGVTHIPQGIGFALLAFVPPVFGLYSSFAPVLLYAVFGTSKHISVGTFPVVALMTGDAVKRISMSYPSCSDNSSNIDNNTLFDNDDPCLLPACYQYHVDIAITISFMVGILMVAMSLIKLGVITLFLSDALISGYTAAAAFSILVTQLPILLGESPKDVYVDPGLAVTPRRFYYTLLLLFNGKVTPSAIVTSIICFIILIGIDITNYILKKKFRKFLIYIPGQLLVVILATGISYGAKLNEKYGLQVINDVGGIPPGKCFKPTVPVVGLMRDVFVEALIIAIVSFVINIAQAKLLAKKNGYSIHSDQEFFAYGVMNIGGSFTGSIPTAGALSRTVLQDATGGNTQLVSFISSFMVLIVILFLGFLFGPLPNAAVGVIVVMALKGLFFQVKDIRRYFYLHWPDMFVWIVVFSTTLFIGLDIGLIIGLLFSLFCVVLRTILPYSPELGEACAWTYPRDLRNKELSDYNAEDLKVHRLSGIYIYQFNAPLYFANRNVFKSRLFIECGVDPQQFDVKVQGCFEQCYDKIKQSQGGVRGGVLSISGIYPLHEEGDDPTNNAKAEATEDSTQYIAGSQIDSINSSIEPNISSFTEENEGCPRHPYHTIILDCGPIGFVDSMGVAMLEQVVSELDSLNIQVLLAAPSTPICEALNRYGFFRRFSSARLFPTVANAVLFAKRGHKVPIIEEPEQLDKKIASNLERQLGLSKRLPLLELKFIKSVRRRLTTPEPLETTL